MTFTATEQETQCAKSMLESFSQYHEYVATLEPFEVQAKRMAGKENPLLDEAYYTVVAAKVKAMEQLVLHLWKQPEIKTNRALINFCRGLQHSIQFHIDEAYA